VNKITNIPRQQQVDYRTENIRKICVRRIKEANIPEFTYNDLSAGEVAELTALSHNRSTDSRFPVYFANQEPKLSS
jgi:hypothetical protein